ncbi:hypothetical protein EDI_349290 [Entamoeba dispar SAW760]|uniref:Uncharacterized protein n=1 Tax=Entamoeba dispar (strain ATCC PRA-260 / SAW760) TaxID=370354 RepID=B0E7I2_ENTDS|nr:uncharacterized protein EDI_349290 [Entamoeba dispar SAW760]EDR29510.1 hypothetical protein EDI_349290 [Entamoeba dispar SAW760]|eukprot:EDR29510.1 hypothetical protein EDI_349290 [Entamoeba dispar SAW760]
MTNLRENISKDIYQKRENELSILRKKRRELFQSQKRGINENEIDYTKYSINDFEITNKIIQTWEYYLYVKKISNEQNAPIFFKYGKKQLQEIKEFESIKDIFMAIEILSKFHSIQIQLISSISCFINFLFTKCCKEILVIFTNMCYNNSFNENLSSYFPQLLFCDIQDCFSQFCDLILSINEQTLFIWINIGIIKRLFDLYGTDNLIDTCTDHLTTFLDLPVDSLDTNDFYQLDERNDSITINILRVLKKWPIIATYYINETSIILLQFLPQNDYEINLFVETIISLSHSSFKTQLFGIIQQNSYLKLNSYKFCGLS